MSSTRVVLCDDEEMVLEALTTAMEALGVIVVGATADPVAAVALVRLFQPDVCVLDAHFPEGSGPETAARMHAEAPGTSIVMLTADADLDVWAAYDNQLLSGIINKTLDCETLYSTIEALSRGERVVAGWNRIPRRQAAPFYLETLTEREFDVLERPRPGGNDRRDRTGADDLDPHGPHPHPEPPAQAEREHPREGDPGGTRPGTRPGVLRSRSRDDGAWTQVPTCGFPRPRSSSSTTTR